MSKLPYLRDDWSEAAKADTDMHIRVSVPHGFTNKEGKKVQEEVWSIFYDLAGGYQALFCEDRPVSRKSLPREHAVWTGERPLAWIRATARGRSTTHFGVWIIQHFLRMTKRIQS